MAYKRARSSTYGRRTRRRYTKPSPYKRYGRKSVRGKFAKNVMAVVNRRAETKSMYQEYADNKTLKHNWVENITNNAFNARINSDAEGTQAAVSIIGRKCFIKGLAIKIIIENQQYRSIMHYTLMLVRNKINPDTSITLKDHMYEGHTDQIPTDYLDTSKVQVMFRKSFKVEQTSMPSTDNAMDASVADGDADGVAEGTMNLIANANYIRSFYIPINKQFHYRDDNLPMPSQRYQWVIMPYCNNSTTTGGSVYPTGHIWMCQKTFYTDV